MLNTEKVLSSLYCLIKARVCNPGLPHGPFFEHHIFKEKSASRNVCDNCCAAVYVIYSIYTLHVIH